MTWADKKDLPRLAEQAKFIFIMSRYTIAIARKLAKTAIGKDAPEFVSDERVQESISHIVPRSWRGKNGYEHALFWDWVIDTMNAAGYRRVSDGFARAMLDSVPAMQAECATEGGHDRHIETGVCVRCGAK